MHYITHYFALFDMHYILHYFGKSNALQGITHFHYPWPVYFVLKIHKLFHKIRILLHPTLNLFHLNACIYIYIFYKYNKGKDIFLYNRS